MYDLSSYKTVSRTDHNGLVHTWRVSKCELLVNKNQLEQKLFDVPVGDKGVLVTYKNPYTGKVSWEVVFKSDKWIVMDSEVLERYIKKL